MQIIHSIAVSPTSPDGQLEIKLLIAEVDQLAIFIFDRKCDAVNIPAR